MSILVSIILILVLLNNFVGFPLATKKRSSSSNGFLFYKTTMIDRRICTCETISSCSCCETVTILTAGRFNEKLCVNFTYQENGLNVNITLDSDTIKCTTINAYRPFKMCASVPGSLFSSICINVLELNFFPRSITVCLRLDISSKKQTWQINYNCISISTCLGTSTNGIGVSLGTTSIVLNESAGLEELIPSGPAGQASLGQEGQILPWQMEQLPSGQEGQTPSGQGEQVPPGQMR